MTEIIQSRTPNEMDYDRHLARLMELQTLREETSFWRDKTSVHAETDRGLPFVFTPIADTHIGHIGCDMGELERYMRFIHREDVYTACVGDMGDFFTPMRHPSGMMGDVITPDDQMLLLKRFMETYKDDVLAVVQDSSHPDWIRQVAGIEPYRWMCMDLNIPLLNNGGMIDLTVNDQKYTVSMYHEIARYNSSFNRTHALKRMRELDRPADVLIGAHRHIGAAEKAVHQSDKPVFVQLGTFKTRDSFGIRRGMVPTPQVFFPTLFFDSRKHNVEVIEDLDTAHEYLDALQRR